MPTIFSHAAAAVALGRTYTTGRVPTRLYVYAAFCSVAPDFDVYGFVLGVRYGDTFGHRGFTHSLLFALALGSLAAWLFARVRPEFAGRRLSLALLFSLATASHGALDALTDGGLGVAFFSPFDRTRYFFPWGPIEVSPIGLGFFSSAGLRVLRSELVWVWLPSAILFAAARLWRRSKVSNPTSEVRN